MPTLVTGFTELFNQLIHYLQTYSDDKRLGQPSFYEVHWRIMDSCWYTGVPQHRPRIFIVGFKRAAMVVPFTWPQMVAPKPLNAFLDGDFGGPNVFESQSATKQRNILKAMHIAPTENCAAAIQVADVGGAARSVWQSRTCARV